MIIEITLTLCCREVWSRISHKLLYVSRWQTHKNMCLELHAVLDIRATSKWSRKSSAAQHVTGHVRVHHLDCVCNTNPHLLTFAAPVTEHPGAPQGPTEDAETLLLEYLWRDGCDEPLMLDTIVRMQDVVKTTWDETACTNQ